jgi:hypothetical protein
MTLHGNFWQEEPYTQGSTQIGHNPLAQATGSRDTFGANASFDMVLNHAGGVFGVPGDYLFRTFIGNDFVFGMWELMRVGEPGKDICRVTRYQEVEPVAGQKRIIVAGVNTVNTDTGEMAKQVEIFAGVGSSKTKLGTADVDPSTGTWVNEFAVATTPQQITVISPLGGTVVSGEVTSAAAARGGAKGIQRLFGNKALEGDPNVNAFRNLPVQDKQPSDKGAKTSDGQVKDQEPKKQRH